MRRYDCTFYFGRKSLVAARVMPSGNCHDAPEHNVDFNPVPLDAPTVNRNALGARQESADLFHGEISQHKPKSWGRIRHEIPTGEGFAAERAGNGGK
jgi:hypothetical protein